MEYYVIVKKNEIDLCIRFYKGLHYMSLSETWKFAEE